MNLLFIHQNFPGQFRHLAPAMAAQGHRVVALGINPTTEALPGVRHVLHRPVPPAAADRLPQASRWNEWAAKVARGESCGRALEALRAEGFVPDVVFAHPGWGEALFVKDVFPACRLLVYAEFFYAAEDGDTFFDPEFSKPPELPALARLRLKNTHLLHALSAADGAVSPTAFQRDRHPASFRSGIRVIHDGIDTDRLRPDPEATLNLGEPGLRLAAGDEVVTFVARHLEPYRGYHVFMRALPLLQRLRPRVRVVLVGGHGVSYGQAAPEGRSWKDLFLQEVQPQLDLSRVHFTGTLPHATLQRLMQVTAVHAYLTYPFVLSWSLLEAMSLGCLIVASRTPPVEEVIRHGENGLLTDFFDPVALAHALADALERRRALGPLRDAARRTAVQQFDLRTRCLPEMMAFVQSHAPAGLR